LIMSLATFQVPLDSGLDPHVDAVADDPHGTPQINLPTE
jgi:hypothetical protein